MHGELQKVSLLAKRLQRITLERLVFNQYFYAKNDCSGLYGCTTSFIKLYHDFKCRDLCQEWQAKEPKFAKMWLEKIKQTNKQTKWGKFANVWGDVSVILAGSLLMKCLSNRFKTKSGMKKKYIPVCDAFSDVAKCKVEFMV